MSAYLVCSRAHGCGILGHVSAAWFGPVPRGPVLPSAMWPCSMWPCSAQCHVARHDQRDEPFLSRTIPVLQSTKVLLSGTATRRASAHWAPPEAAPSLQAYGSIKTAASGRQLHFVLGEGGGACGAEACRWLGNRARPDPSISPEARAVQFGERGLS